MIETYFVERLYIPDRQYGEKYSNYEQRLLDFFYDYLKNFQWKSLLMGNFWKIFHNDFCLDKNYKIFVKVLYKNNLDWKYLKGSPRQKHSIMKKPKRKDLLIINKKAFPFLRCRTMTKK